MSSVPPAFTLIEPPTIVNSLSPLLANESCPLIVVELAVAVGISSVTVVPATMFTALQALGTKPPSQTVGSDQAPVLTLESVEQPKVQLTLWPPSEPFVSTMVWLDALESLGIHERDEMLVPELKKMLTVSSGDRRTGC